MKFVELEAHAGDYDAALESVRKLIEQEHAPDRAYTLLGALLTDVVGDYEGAIDILSEALERFPKSTGIINNLAYTHLQQGDAASAERVLRRCPQDASADVAVTATRGLLSIVNGNLEEGLALYTRAESLARQRRDNHLAEIVLQKKHLEAAKAYWREGNRTAARQETRRGLAATTVSVYREQLLKFVESLRA
ncbi:MAG: tetratricopeptide repeat protein [Thermomicrobiales bacterium]